MMLLTVWTFLKSPLGRYLVAALAVFIVVSAIAWGMGAGDRQRANLAQASQSAADARATSGGDAVNAVAANAAHEAEIDQQSTENRDAILKAPGASAPVDPRVGDAGRRALCLRKSASRDPVCQRLLNPRSE